jgi:FAD/FMN-containing dehydrogenase
LFSAKCAERTIVHIGNQMPMDAYDTAGAMALTSAEIADLRKCVTGSVLSPDDAGYQAECAAFNLMTSLRPAVAVGAIGVADVQATVRFAAKRNLPVAVLATGHQMVHSGEGAVLINMSRMNAVGIDAARSLARVEGGARWQQVLDETSWYGLAPLNGTSPTVGVVGYHLGGGASPVLGRMYGYAADHVQAIEVVTADGELRRITVDSEPDLFWALRGGKSNFGVVTALEFTLFPVKRFYGGGLFFAGEHASKVLHAWREWVIGLPNESSSSIGFLRKPPLPVVPEFLRGKFVIHMRFSSIRSQGEAERELAPMRKIAPMVMDTITEMPYREVSTVFMEPPTPGPWVQGTTVLRDFPGAAADALLDVLGPESSTKLSFVELRPLGGALERPPAVPNAVPGRSAGYSLLAVGGGRPELAPVFEQQLTTLIDAMVPWVQDEIMPNLLSAREGASSKELRAIYGHERYDRLAAIKQRYDPRNLFRVNHNIRSIISVEK